MALHNKVRPLPPMLDTPEFRAKLALAARALRVIQVAVDRGDNEGAGRFYGEWGTRFHEQAAPATPGLLDEVAAAAGVTDLLAGADEAGVDEAMAASLAEAVSLAGPDVGSPVLRIAAGPRAFFGPIVSPAPVGEEAGALWDAVRTLHGVSSFYELKRGRTGPPEFGPP